MRINRLNTHMTTHNNVLVDVVLGHASPHPSPRQWRPATDLYETASHFVVHLEVAGAHPNDFRLTLRGRRLTILGNRPTPPDAPGARAYYQMEVPYGEFHVALDLPAPIDEAHIQAEYHNGLLTVRLPKQAPHTPHIR